MSVLFTLHTPQDLYISAGFVELLRRNASTTETVALVLADDLDDPVGLLSAFDRVERLGSCFYPRPVLALFRLPRILRFRRRARQLRVAADDVLVAYSFREFALNVLIRALRPRPRLVAVRKADAESELLFTRPRPLLSLYWNGWNRILGVTRQRYRWLASSDRTGAGAMLHDPYDSTFTLVSGVGTLGASEVPYPFAALPRRPSGESRPMLVFLGEKYPLQEGQDQAAFLRRFGEILEAVRAGFPGHRKVFKPRGGSRLPSGLSTDGFEVAYADRPLEALLLERSEIDTVLSFKSSGSFVAGLYGAVGVLLYPLCDLSEDYAAALDAYFDPYAASVTVVRAPEELTAIRHPDSAARSDRLLTDAKPFFDVIAPP